MKDFVNEKTLETMKNLVKSVSKAELVSFICSADSSFTTGTAENFLEYLKNKENNQEMRYKTTYTEFVLAVLSYGMVESGYDFEKIATQKMEYYKSSKIQQAKEDAKKWREERRKANFHKLMVDFYLGRITEEDAKIEIFGKADPSSRQLKENGQWKTLNKIKGKLQTKSHNLQKILKLIDEDAERGYGNRAKLSEEERQYAEKIERSHGFVTRW